MKKEIQKYLKEILESRDILGISFSFKSQSKELINVKYGIPTTNSTIGLVDIAFKDKEDKYLQQDNLYTFHKYVSLSSESDFVLSYISNSDFMSKIEIGHIADYLVLLIREFYINKQRVKLQGDLYKLWDVMDSTLKHYVNNELFSLLGKIDVINASEDLSKVNELKDGIKSLIENRNKIFSKKDDVLSDKGIIESGNYYKDNSIIKIES